MGNSNKGNNENQNQNDENLNQNDENLNQNDENLKQNIIDNAKKEAEDNEKINLEKEMEKIQKGTFEDRYKVSESKDPLQFYDKIIGIDSFLKEPEIVWTIEGKSKEKKNDNQNKEEEEQKIDNNQDNNKIEEEIKDNSIVIGIIGLGNVGKSYLLSLFTGEELPSGDSIHTKGISVKNIDKLIILDSEGVEAPLTENNISKDVYPKEDLIRKDINESDTLIQNIAKDKKTVELFIQDFIIEKSNILFIVVGQLTLTEQKLINRVVNETNKNIIFVIHNLKNLYNKQQIENYIETIFKKNVFLNNKTFSEQKYENEERKYEFNKYYTENYKDNQMDKKVIHLIMASNVKNSEAYFFNKTVVDFVRREIMTFSGGRRFDIIDELKEFILIKARKYIESRDNKNKGTPISEEDIKIEKEGDNQFIKIKNKIRLKKCLINQLGFSSFYGALYSPNYLCFIDDDNKEKEKKLIIDITLCGKKEDITINNPKREDVTEEGNKTVISITGTKKLKERKNLELLGSNMDSGDFRIDIVLDNNKYKLSKIPVKKEKMKGNIRFIYTLLNDENNNNSEMKQLNFDSKKKQKEKPKEKNE